MEALKLRDLVASALSAYLFRSRSTAKKGIKRCPFPLVRGNAGPLMKKMNTEIIAKILETDDVHHSGY